VIQVIARGYEVSGDDIRGARKKEKNILDGDKKKFLLDEKHAFWKPEKKSWCSRADAKNMSAPRRHILSLIAISHEFGSNSSQLLGVRRYSPRGSHKKTSLTETKKISLDAKHAFWKTEKKVRVRVFM
jgi:hypothetical protein